MSRFTVYYYTEIHAAVVDADSPEGAIKALDPGDDRISTLWVEDGNEKVVWREKK